MPVHRGNLLQGFIVSFRYPHGGPADRQARPSGHFRPADEERYDYQPQQIHPRTLRFRQVILHQPHGEAILRTGNPCAAGGYG